MKRIKYTLTFTILFFFLGIGIIQAQNETDVLRYSQFSYQASARSAGLSGAMGALGADFSVLSSNPAGLAWYRKSVFEITPSRRKVEVNSLLTNEGGNEVWRETMNKFGLTNIGLVKTMHRPGTDVPTFNFGIGLNELASFNRNFYFRGSSKGSIVNRFQELANGSTNLDNFESGVAFDADALYDLFNDGFYESDFDNAGDALVKKEQVVNTRGSIKEIVVAMAGNIDEKVLIGVSMGLPLVSFEEEKVYKEVDEGTGQDGDIPIFNNLEYTENLTTIGGGVNLKMGVIYRFSQALRFGMAIHTPTLYELTDKYNSSMVYNYTLNESIQEGSAESPDGSFSYSVRTPWRFIGSAAYIFAKKGLLSADLEYVNYSNAELQYDSFIEEERDANQLISKNLKAAINLRIGGEMALDIFRLRGGFELNQSAIEGDNIFSTGYSLGAGVRARGVFFDIAFKNRLSKEAYIPYRTFEAPEQLVDNDNKITNIIMTLGFRF